MKASVLAVGTELTTGQIINKNAAELSAKLKNFGVIVNYHLTVPDEKTALLSALKFLEDKSELLFITGGLGPTSDDFTRDVVAEWAQLNMKFNESAWNSVVERLSSRGFKVREMQRQQCFFPENSSILTNSEGTAHAFTFTTAQQTVFVLPGPPREIEAIWKAHIDALLKKKTHNLKKIMTKSWDTLGLGETEVAHHVEDVLKQRPKDRFFEIGYRVHLPYVEVKLTYQEGDLAHWEPWIQKIDQILSPITVARDFMDVADIAVRKISDCDFIFYDYVSKGYLHSRLSSHLKNTNNWSFKQSGDPPPSTDFFNEEDNFLALLPFEENKAVLLFSAHGARGEKTLEAPMKSPLMQERRRQYFAEMALVEFLRN